MNKDRQADVIRELTKGRPLTSAQLGTVDGRIDCTGLTLNPIKVSGTRFFSGMFVKASGATTFSRGHYRGVDFTGSRLDNLTLEECSFEDSVFDESTCRGWRMWGCVFVNCSFRNVDLRGASLGGVDGIGGQRRNTYRNVRFKGSDFRGTAYISATFSDCEFLDCRLDQVDFNGSVLERCRFVGELKEVVFHDRAFGGERFPPNELAGCDFTDAVFRNVDMRGVDLQNAIPPAAPDHFIIEPYRERLLDAELAFKREGAHEVAWYLAEMRKRSKETQLKMVDNYQDWVKSFGADVAAKARLRLSA
jgi:uncharacterized protein YjbI with pentapeptide repeats